MRSIKKDQAFSSFIYLVDSTDHVTPVTDKVKADITVYYSKAGGTATSLGQSDFTWTELSDSNLPGHYYYGVTLTSVTGTLGELLLRFSTSSTDPVGEEFLVVPITSDYAVGNGIRKVTITSTGVSNVLVSIYDSSNTELQVKGNTGSGQSIDFYLNDGTYKIRSTKIGYIFTLDTLVVVQDMTQDVEGTVIDNTPPDVPNVD